MNGFSHGSHKLFWWFNESRFIKWYKMLYYLLSVLHCLVFFELMWLASGLVNLSGEILALSNVDFNWHSVLSALQVPSVKILKGVCGVLFAKSHKCSVFEKGILPVVHLDCCNLFWYVVTSHCVDTLTVYTCKMENKTTRYISGRPCLLSCAHATEPWGHTSDLLISLEKSPQHGMKRLIWAKHPESRERGLQVIKKVCPLAGLNQVLHNYQAM